MEHYFTSTNTEDIRKEINYYINDKVIKYITSNAVFSKNKVDFGTNLMIKTFMEHEDNEIEASVLDIGCGYGVVGITLATFFNNITIDMVDVSERAVELAKENTLNNGFSGKINVYQSNIYENVNKKFDFILSNPPIRAGKEVIYKIYEDAYKYLKKGGILYVVIQKKQGAKSSKEKIESIFGNCTMLKRDSGYHIYVAKKV